MESVQSSTQGSAAANNTQQRTTTADYQTFLRLLVAEMQNQDPTAPMDSTEYIAQLASFSNVEQGVQMNEKLDQILKYSELTQAANLIGKTVIGSDGLSGGVVEQVRVTDNGIIASLEGGGTMTIDSNVTISA